MNHKNLVLIFAALLLAACGQEDERGVRGCKEDQALGHDGLCYVQEAKVNEAGTQNLVLLHKVAILGKHLKKEDVFRYFKRSEVQKGGKFNAIGALLCRKENRLNISSAFVIQNRRGEKRLIATKHSLVDRWDAGNEARNTDISLKCNFITSEDFFDEQRRQGKCYLPDSSTNHSEMNKFFSCMKSHGMVHEIHPDRQSLKVEPSKYSDLVVLKFKNSSPRVIPLKLLNLQKHLNLQKRSNLQNKSFFTLLNKYFTTEKDKKSFTTEKDAKSFTTKKDEDGNTFLLLNGERYRGILPSGGLGRVTKKSCSIYPKHSKQMLFHNENDFLTDCHSFGGFSGSPLILEKESSGELLVPCMLTGKIGAKKVTGDLVLMKIFLQIHALPLQMRFLSF